jgi:hypothetical protein
VIWRDDGVGSNEVARTVADASGAWQAQVSVALEAGNYLLKAQQTDVAGNVSIVSPPMALIIEPKVNLNLTALLRGNVAPDVNLIDVNQDGKVDIVSGFVYFQQADGSFIQSSLNPTNTIIAANGAVIAGTSLGQFVDVNGDGKTDFVNWSTGSNFLTVDGNSVAFGRNIYGSYYGNNASGQIANILGAGIPSALINGGARLELATNKYVGIAGDTTGSNQSVIADFNGDGYLDYISNSGNLVTNTGKGTFITTNTNTDSFYAGVVMSFDANRDGYADIYYGSSFWLGKGNGSFVKGTSQGLPNVRIESSNIVVADFDGNGWVDVILSNNSGGLSLYLSQGGVFTEKSASLFFEQSGIALTVDDGSSLSASDLNGDRSVDFIYSDVNGALQAKLNSTNIAENTYLRVVVTDKLGVADRMTGATVFLYDSVTGLLVGSDSVGKLNKGSFTAQAGNMYAEFFGLDPLKTYDIVVRYPGSDQGVTVVTGKSGLGVGGIDPAVLNQIVDSQLTAVSAAGKDVIYVAPEIAATSTDGGRHVGTVYADWMLGDAGDDVFTPNGARIGEVGDTVDMRNGGNDTVIFQQAANLNTPTKVMGADLTSAVGAGGDVMDVSGLLTALGYTGSRDAASVSSVLTVVANGTGITLRAYKPGVGFQDLANVQGSVAHDVSALTLAQLVSGGHVLLGGLALTSFGVVTVDENTAQLGAVPLFPGVKLSAEGDAYAHNFAGGHVSVWLDNGIPEDVLSIASGVNGVTVASNQVSYGGAVIGSIDTTSNGLGQKLTVNFSFAGSPLSAAQQANAVDAVMQSVQYKDAGSTPPDFERNLWLEVSDGQVASKVASLLTVTPLADMESIGGIGNITGTNGSETLTGTTANELLTGYGGPVANAGTSSAAGDTLIGGGGVDTFIYRTGNVGKDTITDFTVGGVGVVAGADKLNLAELLKGYFNPATSNVNDFVQLQALSTTGTKVLVDFNGKADGSTFTPYMEIDLAGVTLASTGMADYTALRTLLITTNHQIIMA